MNEVVLHQIARMLGTVAELSAHRPALTLRKLVGLMLLCDLITAHAVAGMAPYSRTNLMSFLAGWEQAPAPLKTICELDPQWVGTVKRVHLRDDHGIHKENQPN